MFWIDFDDPNPVSISTRRGKSHAEVILLASSTTSSSLVKPRSGKPKDDAATPLPER